MLYKRYAQSNFFISQLLRSIRIHSEATRHRVTPRKEYIRTASRASSSRALQFSTTCKYRFLYAPNRISIDDTDTLTMAIPEPMISYRSSSKVHHCREPGWRVSRISMAVIKPCRKRSFRNPSTQSTNPPFTRRISTAQRST